MSEKGPYVAGEKELDHQQDCNTSKCTRFHIGNCQFTKKVSQSGGETTTPRGVKKERLLGSVRVTW